MALRLGGKLLTWSVTLVVIRLLTPADYGLMALASLVIGFAGLFGEPGLSAVLIQKAALEPALVRQVQGLVLVTRLLLTLVVLALAPWVTAFFADPRLLPVVQVLALVFVIGAPAVVPAALLARELAFKRLALVELAAAVLASLAVLGLALAGYGVWALVAGTLVEATLTAGGTLALARRWTPPSWRWQGLRAVWGFGLRVRGQGVLVYLNKQLPILLIGRLLGQEAVGLYSVGNELARLPVRLLLRALADVSFAGYARLQQRRRARLYFLRFVEGVSLLFVPVLWLLALLADELVPLLFGAHWAGAAVVLRALALVLPLWALTRLLTPVLNGLGRADIPLYNQITAALLLTLAAVIGVRWGLAGVAWAISAAYALAALLNIRRGLRVLGLSWRWLVVALWPALCSAGLLVVTALLVGLVLAQVSGYLRLPLVGLLSGAVYGAVLWWRFPRVLRRSRRWLR